MSSASGGTVILRNQTVSSDHLNATWPLGTWNIATVSATPATLKINDGTTLTDAAAQAYPGTDTFYFGGLAGLGFLEMQLGECIMVDRILTEGELDSAIAYLSEKWGIGEFASVAGASSRALTITGSATGVVQMSGQGESSIALTLNGTAAGTVSVTGASAATIAITGSAAGNLGISVISSIDLILNGSDGSTTITDASPYAHTASVQGNAQISTAQSLSGGSSLRLDGSGDYVSFGPSTAAFNIGTGDFEIACDIRRSAGTEIGAWQLGTVAGGQDAFTAGVLCLFAANYGGPVNLWVISSGLGALDLGVSLPLNTWRRVRLARFGGLFRVSVAGTQVYSVASTEDFSGQYLNIGVASTSLWWNGFIDNFAMAKGGTLAAWP
jgi:hypothetical protein